MRLSKTLLVSFQILILTSCESTSIKKIPLPEVETCTILSSTAFCIDKRKPKGQRERELDFREILTYSCISPLDKKALENDIDEKRKELAKFRRNSKKKSKRKRRKKR